MVLRFFLLYSAHNTLKKKKRANEVEINRQADKASNYFIFSFLTWLVISFGEMYIFLLVRLWL